jgi:hypothetical protein
MENDEYVYSCIFWTSHPITNLPDIIQSMRLLYFEWSGRILYNGLFLQSLLFFGKIYTALVSALCFSLLGVVMIQLNGIKTKFNKSDVVFYALFCLLVWFFLPDIASIIWITGSANYLWPFIFLFLFLFPYINIVKQINAKKSIFPYVFPLIAIIAGLSTEIFSAIGGVSVLGLLFIAMKRKIRIPKHLWIGLIFFIIGTIILFFAPGNFRRAAADPSASILSNFSVSAHMLYHNYFYQIIIVLAILIFLFLWNHFSKNKKDLSIVYAIFAGSILSVVMVAFTPEFYDRALIPALIVIFMLILYLAKSFIKEKVINNRFFLIAVLLLVVVMFISQFQVMGVYSDINTQMMERDKIIHDNLLKGVANIDVPPLKMTASRYVHKSDISTDSDNVYNKILAVYWGAKSIALNGNDTN